MAECDTLPRADSVNVTVDTTQFLVTADCTPPPCPADWELVNLEIDRVATQYREADRFLALLRAFLRQVEIVAQVQCGLPTFFDLPTATGDQLTLLGKRLGFPRCHCVCAPVHVFGFDCNDGYSCDAPNIVGFCPSEPDATWQGCAVPSISTLCLDNDTVYRWYLYARIYQTLGLFDLSSLTSAIRWIWGETAWIVDHGNGRVVVSPGRDLSEVERIQVPVAFRVFPVAPGIKAMIHYGGDNVFGFGEGWGGFCERAEWLCPCDPHPYDCAN